MERMDPMDMPAVSALAPRPRVMTRLPGLALAAVLVCAFGVLASDVWAGEGFALDRVVMGALHGLASPWLTAAMRVVTASASGLMITALALGLGLRWWRQVGRRTEAITLLIALAGSAGLGQGLKLLFARPRPHLFPWLTGARGWSFPSGHTLTATVLGGLLAWLIGRRLSSWRRVALWVGAGLWVVLVGLSRVYLGVHYPSDVLASLAIGGLCLLVTLYVGRVNVSQPAA
jgi:membrane-associated phospholipid phosphatase